MCWVTNRIYSSEKNLIEVAQEDIECFKVITVRKLRYFHKFDLGKEEIFSYFMNFRYKLNKLYELNKPINIYYKVLSFRADEGFHSYSLSKCTVKQQKANYWHCEDYIDIISKAPIGFPSRYISSYSNITRDKHNRERRTEIIKCIIPKGSHYAINELGEIVSDKIILKELILSKFH